ncbi:trigger factor [Polycyclovorans algicola]|uniref:trigger factor n=1 Tax=Polycyclovorans algicola TaxID=616992 RepID=UPI0004A727D4|nr:trigger factor [Polycyclovorans algicola]
MEVTLHTPGGLRRELHVRLPAERLTDAVNDRLKRMSARAKVPGFRPGKAPRKVLEQQYGEAARFDAINDLVNASYPAAVKQSGVTPAGQPQIDITTEKTGEPLEYVAKFEIYPEVVLSGLESIQINKPDVTVTDADIDRLIDNLRRAKRVFAPVERAAEKGDNVTIDFVGKIDGEAFDGGSGSDVKVELGEGRFLPDLEKGIEGHAAGENFSVKVDFPEDYRAEALRGKQAQFDVNLKQVEGAELPDIADPEFLKSHQIDPEGGVASLREKCQTALLKERDKAVRNNVKQQVMEALLKANDIEVPEALVTAELPRMQQEAAQRMGLQNLEQISPEQLDQMMPASLFEPQAKRRVALGLLVGEVIKTREIKLDADRVNVEIEQIAADYDSPEQVKQFYQSRPDLLQGLRAMVLEDQVVDSLVASATVNSVTQSLEDLLRPQQQGQPG